MTDIKINRVNRILKAKSALHPTTIRPLFASSLRILFNFESAVSQIAVSRSTQQARYPVLSRLQTLAGTQLFLGFFPGPDSMLAAVIWAYLACAIYQFSLLALVAALNQPYPLIWLAVCCLYSGSTGGVFCLVISPADIVAFSGIIKWSSKICYLHVTC